MNEEEEEYVDLYPIYARATDETIKIVVPVGVCFAVFCLLVKFVF